METRKASTSIIDMEDGTGAFACQCNDCGASVMNGKPEDIEHYHTCTPTPMTDDYYNSGMTDKEESELINSMEEEAKKGRLI